MESMNCFGKEQNLFDLEHVIDKMLPEMDDIECKSLREIFQKCKTECDLQDPDSFWEWLNKNNCKRPLAYLRYLFNIMKDEDNFSPIHILWLFNQLQPKLYTNKSYRDTSDNFNDILMANVINPLARLISEPNFKWEYLKDVQSATDYERLKRLLECNIPEVFLYDTRDYGLSAKEIPLWYRVRTSPLFDIKSLKESVNKEKYLNSLNLLYADNCAQLYHDWITKIPIEALSAIIVLSYFGIPTDNLANMEDIVIHSDFWRYGLHLKDVVFSEDTKITEEHCYNLVYCYMFLTGSESYFRQGNNPMLELLREVASVEAGKEFVRNKVTSTSLDINQKYYFNNQNFCFAIPELAMPFNWEKVKNAINSLVYQPYADITVTKKLQGDVQSTALTHISLEGKARRWIPDPYNCYPFEKVLWNARDIEDLGKIFKNMFAIGSKIHCYDPYLCYSLMVMLQHNFTTKLWMQIYANSPLLFDACLFKAVIAYTEGAKDYEILFKDEENGYKMLCRAARTVGVKYNFLSALSLDLARSLGCNDLQRLKTDLNAESLVISKNGDVLELTLQELIANNYTDEQRQFFSRKLLGGVADNKLIWKVIG